MGRPETGNHLDQPGRGGRQQGRAYGDALAVRGRQEHDRGVDAWLQRRAGDDVREEIAMRRRWVAGSLLVAAAGVVVVFYAIRAKDAGAAAETRHIVHPERRKVRNLVNATGTVRLRVGSEVRVGSQLSGMV